MVQVIPAINFTGNLRETPRCHSPEKKWGFLQVLLITCLSLKQTLLGSHFFGWMALGVFHTPEIPMMSWKSCDHEPKQSCHVKISAPFPPKKIRGNSDVRFTPPNSWTEWNLIQVEAAYPIQVRNLHGLIIPGLKHFLELQGGVSYCWWRKSCTTCDV